MLCINCHGMTSNTCIPCTPMLASMHKMYLSHLTSSFFSLADKGSAFHMIHIIQLWDFDSADMIRIIGVVWIFLFVILSVQQELASLGLSSVNVQAFISCAILIKMADCVQNSYHQQMHPLLLCVLSVYCVYWVPCSVRVARCMALSTHTTAWNTCCHNTATLITMYF